MAQNVSLKQVAEKASVSVVTASNILNQTGGGRFSEKTREAVLRVAKELDYVPNRAAQAMRTQRTGIIGFVTQSFCSEAGVLENFTLFPFLAGLNKTLAESSRHVALVEHGELRLESVGDLPLAIRQRFFDGLVIHFSRSSLIKHLLEEFDIPVIYWDCGMFEEANCIHRDEFKAGHELSQLLIKRGLQKIAFYGGPQRMTEPSVSMAHFSRWERLKGYQQALMEANLPEFHLGGADPASLAKQLSIARPEAVIIEGTAPSSLLVAFTKLGWSIPEDISLISLDVEARIQQTEDLAGMRYDRYDAGCIAGRMMAENLKHRGSNGQSVVLPAVFYEGKTLRSTPKES